MNTLLVGIHLCACIVLKLVCSHLMVCGCTEPRGAGWGHDHEQVTAFPTPDHEVPSTLEVARQLAHRRPVCTRVCCGRVLWPRLCAVAVVVR